MIFEITKEEEQEIERWKKSLPTIPSDVFGEEYLYSYCFQPTGLGTIFKVGRVDGEELDLTDYDSW